MSFQEENVTPRTEKQMHVLKWSRCSSLSVHFSSFSLFGSLFSSDFPISSHLEAFTLHSLSMPPTEQELGEDLGWLVTGDQ